MATKKWFVLIDNEEMGPLGPGGLRRLVRKGEITSDTKLRREDHSDAVFASQVCGLLPEDQAAADATEELEPEQAQDEEIIPTLHDAVPERPRSHAPRHRNRIYGPFTELRTQGWATAATMFLFALLGAYGVYIAIGQLGFVQRYETEPLLVEEGVYQLFGLGVFAVLGLVAAGCLFMWWIWIARINLPHLINARIVNPPGWAVMAWLIPLLNLVKPYLVVAEIDRLSAEAEADGDARVEENHRLLAPWWATAILGTLLALSYMLVGVETIEELSFAAWLHLAAGLCTVASGVLAGIIVLRVTRNQEHAHERHPEPVELHHEFGRRRHRRVAVAQ